jgi:Tannase and feruloyl esterase
MARQSIMTTSQPRVAEYCKVLGNINPVDPAVPKIKFQVNLPANWNRKAMMFGGGGYNGVLAIGLANVPAGPADKPAPLARGYATFGSDSGHQASANGSHVSACNAAFNPATAMLNGAPLRCSGGADIADSCLSDAQIAGFNVTNTALTLNYNLASCETT